MNKTATELGYNNCTNRSVKTFTTKDGQLRSWGRCSIDYKNCNQWAMEGYDCYES